MENDSKCQNENQIFNFIFETCNEYIDGRNLTFNSQKKLYRQSIDELTNRLNDLYTLIALMLTE